MNLLIALGVIFIACASIEAAGKIRYPREAIKGEVPENVLNDRANYLKNWREAMKYFRLESTQPPVAAYSPPAQQHRSGGKRKANEPTEVEFKCPKLDASATVPTSVHQLRPADIGIVAAMGDSITAGNGVRAPMDMPWLTAIPNRGESFSVGGERSLDEGVMTLTNILRKYNENVTGSSNCARARNHDYAGFNLAIPGDTSRGMENQARQLIQKMLDKLDIEEYFNSWKIVTLFIGGNDLCQHCLSANNMEDFSAAGYTRGIKRGLDLLNQWLPRAYVNLQIMADVSVVKDLIHPGFQERCDLLHGIECACAMNANFSGNLRNLQLEYYQKLVELVRDTWYDNRDDFTVVIQPFLRDQLPFKLNGSIDMSFFAPDCFHPSVKTHQAFALGLWNSMLTPVGQKFFGYEEFENVEYLCPSESAPYFFTNLNSGPPSSKK